MASHTHGTDPIKRKEKPTLTPSKKEELNKLKAKLAEAEAKLKKDPDNKRLKEITKNLKQMFELERERGYSC
ncbi:MAG: hypothetical protein IJQ90_00375 [Alphaproteobacteria bacterium]|nr:hypothetical protein [Alphaproteobacteria bacterium]